MLEKRKSASSVVLNQRTLWVTGGNGGVEDKKSTEFISLDQQPSVQGPVLPFTIKFHSMVEANSTSIYIIGGVQNGRISNKTWISDPTNNFEITPGPPLNSEREGHCCSKMKIDGRIFLVVAGGNSSSFMELETNFKSVELLDLNAENPKWQTGKYYRSN